MPSSHVAPASIIRRNAIDNNTIAPHPTVTPMEGDVPRPNLRLRRRFPDVSTSLIVSGKDEDAVPFFEEDGEVRLTPRRCVIF